MCGPDGAVCSSFTLSPAGGKGLYEKRKPSGLFFPTDRRPQPGETWHGVEGVKDAAALHGLGLLAFGMPSNALAAKFARLFAGVDVVLVPDRDRAGMEGADKSGRALFGHAASIRIAALPAEFKETKGADVRDVLHKPDGESLVHRAIVDAVTWEPKQLPIEHEADELPSVREPEGRTEAATARRLVERFGQDLRWCDTWSKWLIWDNRRWAIDDQCKVESRAKEIADSIWKAAAEAMAERDEKTLPELMRFAKQINSANGVRNVVVLARSESGIPITPERFDLDPFALNVLNGALDLRTGALRPHSRADYLTKLCPVEYRPEAACPIWCATLARVMADSQAMVDFLQRIAGYCLSGSVEEHAAFIAYGTGANGKSTILAMFEAVLGPDYSMKAPSGLLMAKQNEHPTALADLQGKRFVSCIETDDGQRLAESLVKELTGGDNIRARRMRENFWQFKPQHKIWLATNHKPRVRGTDAGIWRRIKLIPFKVSIPAEDQDKTLPEKLRAELPGILAWMVQGFAQWQRHGLAEPTEVLQATAAYRNEEDVIGAFLAVCCIASAAHKVRSSSIYRAYAKWAEENGERVASQRRFGSELTERGFERFTNNGTWYQGIGLLAE